ncbi:MAG: FAD-binding oxidoreductase [Candidatus Paceibacterota bacterium]
MKENKSPWLTQLRKDRVHFKLDQDIKTDIAIMGAGIAGISTAFFLLKYTDKNVVVLEKNKLAHGSTGHNAGQVVSYFERGFASLVDSFGLELASRGQRDIEDAWNLLDEMYTDARLDINFSRFLGHAGLSSFDQVLLHLKNNFFRKRGGLDIERILISSEADFINEIPHEYQDLYTLAVHKNILELLETQDESFVAVLSYQKGCVNSALFCEEVLLYLIEKYGDRFHLYEKTLINKVVLKDDYAILDAETHTVEAKNIILCTNGFEGFHILNEGGLDIDTKFHHLVKGTIGYMSGYLEPMDKNPIAISYFTNPDATTDDPYFYLTRRNYEMDKNYNLISIGGPEIDIEDGRLYSRKNEFPDEMVKTIDDFVRSVYDKEPNKEIDYVYTWHGLMGYTRNGIRLIGPEPKNKTLLYNLGCNGVGILPSVYGGKRISEIFLKEKLEKTIFDVPESI